MCGLVFRLVQLCSRMSIRVQESSTFIAASKLHRLPRARTVMICLDLP